MTHPPQLPQAGDYCRAPAQTRIRNLQQRLFWLADTWHALQSQGSIHALDEQKGVHVDATCLVSALFTQCASHRGSTVAVARAAFTIVFAQHRYSCKG